MEFANDGILGSVFLIFTIMHMDSVFGAKWKAIDCELIEKVLEMCKI